MTQIVNVHKGTMLCHFAKEMVNYEVQRTVTIIANCKYVKKVTILKIIGKSYNVSKKITTHLYCKEGDLNRCRQSALNVWVKMDRGNWLFLF